MDAGSLLKQSDKLYGDIERVNAGHRWDVQSKYLNPNQSGFFQGNESKGTKRTDDIYDNTGIQESDDLAATIHSTLTSPSIKWSKWKFKETKLNEDEECAEWLEDSHGRFHDAINASNFNTESNKCYISYVKHANMALFMDSVNEGGKFLGFNFKAWHLSQLAWAEDQDSLVSVVHRKFKMTVRQAMDRWGNAAPAKIKECAKDGDMEKEFRFRWILQPRHPNKVKFNALGLARPNERPIESVIIFEKDKSIAEIDGYYEMPCFVTRWTTDAEEKYGRGPGDLALPEVRSLNEAEKLVLQSFALAARPPYKATKRGILGSFNFQPGKVTFVKSMEELQEMKTSARFDVIQLERAERREKIKKAFYNDKLRLPPRTEIGEMTAYETAERLAEVHKVLGPQIARLDTEFQDPLSLRGFNLMLRGGAFKELPAKLKEKRASIAIEYVNPLARTQKFDELNAMDMWVRKIVELSGAVPEVLDVIETDIYAKNAGRIQGVPESAIRDDKKIKEIRERRDAALEEERQIKLQQIQADSASKVANSGVVSGN